MRKACVGACEGLSRLLARQWPAVMARGPREGGNVFGSEVRHRQRSSALLCTFSVSQSGMVSTVDGKRAAQSLGRCSCSLKERVCTTPRKHQTNAQARRTLEILRCRSREPLLSSVFLARELTPSFLGVLIVLAVGIKIPPPVGVVRELCRKGCESGCVSPPAPGPRGRRLRHRSTP